MSISKTRAIACAAAFLLAVFSFAARADDVRGDNGAVAVPGANVAPDRATQFHSGQSQHVIDQETLKKVGPMASPAQGMVFTPGGGATSPGLIGGPGGRVMLDGLSAGRF
jgi:hypothetical protein